MKRLSTILCIMMVAAGMGGFLARPAAAWDYQVQWGDSLYDIAQRTGVSIGSLRAANGTWSDLILAGGSIWVPDGASQTVSDNSRAVDLLARLIHAEAGGEPFAGQVAVGAVVMNRLQDAKFPATLAENIFRQDEFESVSNGYIWTEPTAGNYEAAREAMAGWDPTGGATYFFNPGKTFSAWMWSRTILTQIGDHVFAR